MKTYSEKLKDPRWQKKRLEIMNRENFKCENCNSSSNTLNVHHGYYARGLDPWEYDSTTLHCLCENCHEERHSYETDLLKQLAKLNSHEFYWFLTQSLVLASHVGIRKFCEILIKEQRKVMSPSQDREDFWKIMDTDLPLKVNKV